MIVNIPQNKLSLNVNDIWANKWFLLTSGNYEERNYNTMTVGWGFNGIMWNKPIAVVVVRPTRYTYEFIEKFPTFTLTAFPEKYRSDLEFLGNTSGRDGDKISKTDLEVTSSKIVEAPSFKEAELTFECKKIYQHKFDPTSFIEKSIDNNYPIKDYHTAYYGEIVAITGEDKYLAKENSHDI